MRLINIYDFDEEGRLGVLYELLSERTPEQSISHKGMPTLTEHKQFVERHPYSVWFFIVGDDNDTIYGSLYLTVDREIGIAVFKDAREQGVGSDAIKELFKIHKGPFYANINPENKQSMDFFEGKGFKHIQNTLKLEADDAVGC